MKSTASQVQSKRLRMALVVGNVQERQRRVFLAAGKRDRSHKTSPRLPIRQELVPP